MTDHAIYSESTLSAALGAVRDAYRREGRCKVKITTGRRSINQNDMSHAWYEQLAHELREDDALGWKCYCKLHHGVPILRAEDAEFRAAYDSAIKGLSYEQKLKVMTLLPVTSLMSKAQLSAYLKAVQEDFRARGVALEFPEERRWAA
jgi:hypothetical protein